MASFSLPLDLDPLPSLFNISPCGNPPSSARYDRQPFSNFPKIEIYVEQSRTTRTRTRCCFVTKNNRPRTWRTCCCRWNTPWYIRGKAPPKNTIPSSTSTTRRCCCHRVVVADLICAIRTLVWPNQLRFFPACPSMCPWTWPCTDTIRIVGIRVIYPVLK